jgi:hypothetical protein
LIDELNDGPRASFVARRRAVAARLRAEGRADEARRLERERKPSAPDWAVDRVAREDPAAFRRALAATRRAERAQRAALRRRGGGGELRTALREWHRALDELAAEAVGILAREQKVSPALRRAIEERVRARAILRPGG